MKPKKWIAVVLGIFAAPLAFLYVGAPRWALISFAVSLVVGIASFMLPGGSAQIGFVLISLAVLVVWIWRASNFAAAAAETTARPWYARWYGLIGITAAVGVVIMLLRVFLYEPFKAPSTSMTPAIPRGANLLVQKWGYGHYSASAYRLGNGAISAPVARGDIIVFDYPLDPGTTYVKRVVGLPGDKIVYRDKHVWLNGVDTRGNQLGEYLDEDRLTYFKRYQERFGKNEHQILVNDDLLSFRADAVLKLPPECTAEYELLSCTVPANSYFVMGDHRDNSLDSRYWGFVPAKSVVGKVVYIVPPRG